MMAAFGILPVMRFHLLRELVAIARRNPCQNPEFIDLRIFASGRSQHAKSVGIPGLHTTARAKHHQ
jgi:hypothetical protein